MNKLNINTPKWFWFFILPLLILGIMGLLQIGSIFDEEMPEPIWAKIGHVLGIFGIFLGGLFLTFRKRIAILFFVISVLGFLAHRFWIFALSNIVDSLVSYAPLTLFISVALDLLAIWIAAKGIKRGWIK